MTQCMYVANKHGKWGRSQLHLMFHFRFNTNNIMFSPFFTMPLYMYVVLPTLLFSAILSYKLLKSIGAGLEIHFFLVV